jgi:hypothetical protein
VDQDHIAHSLNRAAVHSEQGRHFVQGKAFDALGERVHKFEGAVEVAETL